MNPTLQIVLNKLAALMQESAEKLSACYDDHSALIPSAASNTIPAVIAALSAVSTGVNAILDLEKM